MNDEIERRLAEYAVRAVRCVATERIRSNFGALSMEGIQAEIMGGRAKTAGKWGVGGAGEGGGGGGDLIKMV
jgi:hypothetical protein